MRIISVELGKTAAIRRFLFIAFLYAAVSAEVDAFFLREDNEYLGWLSEQGRINFAHIAASLAGFSVVLLLAFGYAGCTDETDYLRDAGWKRVSFRYLVLGALIGTATAVTAMVLRDTALFKHGLHINISSSGLAHKNSVYGVSVWAAIKILLVPPIEEFVFRGVLFKELGRAWGTVSSGFMVTVLFVIAHMASAQGNFGSLFMIAVFGAIVMTARIITKSLAPGMVMHGAHNLVVAIWMIAISARFTGTET
ncbi:CPBP family intramembrane glutamic endopeptidase [Methylococcus sp. EFPC2]|uniref:CPBP family intramembrane glutamic endopeptidase n=1 Tax=Methylococcus sp. EFPC2 TaxID=2812648 RepID=UPI0019676252|nr:CPBP family intramembrane glutamic endopeptidase [Methylococcus sp. EFPC2]QSA98427.1 CPBP family intramembrane metalloprotease [Methylococcus sp. EFPC2]